MSWYFFTMNKGDREWKTFLADQFQEVLERDKPEFHTVLDCNHSFKDGVE